MSIEIRSVCCTYGSGTPFETKALKNISLTIEKGEFVGIMGRTGCGKSTLIQAIAGLIPISGGQLLLDGEDINAKSYDRSVFCGASSASYFSIPNASFLNRQLKKMLHSD